uniref:Uncharacterized protein n=1 Tax=Anguilla anguilla TaxID=7936 RepID=A0A0E9WLC9_ANGAN
MLNKTKNKTSVLCTNINSKDVLLNISDIKCCFDCLNFRLYLYLNVTFSN